MGGINLSGKRSLAFLIENPITGDDIPRVFVPRQFLVEQIRALKIGGSGTFDWAVRFSPNANDQGAGTLLHSDSGVNNVTTGVIYSPPFTEDPGLIPANSWVWLELPAVSIGAARPVAATVELIGVEKGP